MKTRLMVCVVSAVLAGAIGFFLVDRAGDPKTVVDHVDRQLVSAFAPNPVAVPPRLVDNVKNITQVAPAWTEIENISNGLTFQNEQVAKAKALLRYDSRPEPAESYIWDDRAAIAAGGWRIEEPTDLWTKRAKFVLLGAVGGFVLTFGVLASLAWLWTFLLDRVRELSDAVRGK